MTVLFTRAVMTKTTRWLKQQKCILWVLKIQDEVSAFCLLLRPLCLARRCSPSCCVLTWSLHGISLCVQMSFSPKEAHVCAKSLQSCWTLCTLWVVACQDPPSIGFSRQEFWSGLPFPPPVDLSNAQLKRISLMSYVISFLLCYGIGRSIFFNYH